MVQHQKNETNAAQTTQPPPEVTSGTMGFAIKVGVAGFAMIIAIIMLAFYAIGNRPLGASNEAANSAEGVKSRIGPTTTFVVDETKGPVAGAPAPIIASATAVAGETPAAAPIIAAVAIPSAAPAGGLKTAGGEGTYKASCAVCHSAGIAGAPKSGDKAAWAPRIAQGKETLYKHAILGFQGKNGVMPAKGGNSSLSDADMKATVDYMVALNK